MQYVWNMIIAVAFLKTNAIEICKVNYPTFYNDPKDLLSLLELIIGSIDAGNDNSKIKNRGMAILDELLKLGAISKDQHEKLYIGYLI